MKSFKDYLSEVKNEWIGFSSPNLTPEQKINKIFADAIQEIDHLIDTAKNQIVSSYKPGLWQRIKNWWANLGKQRNESFLSEEVLADFERELNENITPELINPIFDGLKSAIRGTLERKSIPAVLQAVSDMTDGELDATINSLAAELENAKAKIKELIEKSAEKSVIKPSEAPPSPKDSAKKRTKKGKITAPGTPIKPQTTNQPPDNAGLPPVENPVENPPVTPVVSGPVDQTEKEEEQPPQPEKPKGRPRHSLLDKLAKIDWEESWYPKQPQAVKDTLIELGGGKIDTTDLATTAKENTIDKMVLPWLVAKEIDNPDPTDDEPTLPNPLYRWLSKRKQEYLEMLEHQGRIIDKYESPERTQELIDTIKAKLKAPEKPQYRQDVDNVRDIVPERDYTPEELALYNKLKESNLENMTLEEKKEFFRHKLSCHDLQLTIE